MNSNSNTQQSKMTAKCECGQDFTTDTPYCPPCCVKEFGWENGLSSHKAVDITDEMNNLWNWTATTIKSDNTIIKKYPKNKTIEQIHAKVESEYPEYVWDWTISEEKREVHIFKNHWRMEEERLRAEGKTLHEIWELEAIGKAERMRDYIAEKCGEEEAQKYWKQMEDYWATCKKRRAELKDEELVAMLEAKE